MLSLLSVLQRQRYCMVHGFLHVLPPPLDLLVISILQDGHEFLQSLHLSRRLLSLLVL